MVSLPVADKSNLKDKETIVVYSSVAQVIMVRKPRLQEPDAAGHVTVPVSPFCI